MRNAETLARLERHITDARALKDKDLLDQVMHSALAMECFQAVNTAIDLAEHLITEKNLGFPATYKETFETLRQYKIIDEETLKDLKRLVFLRNLIAHEYYRIKTEELQDMTKRLGSLEKLAEEIKKAGKSGELGETVAAYSEPDEKIEGFLKVARTLKDHKNVAFAIYYGSSYEGRALPESDIDVCVYYEGTAEEQWTYRKNLLKELPDEYDVQIYQQLPLHVRKEVLKGRPIYVKDQNFFQQIAEETLNQYEDFRPGLMRYLREEEIKPRTELILIKLKEAEEAADTVEKNLPATFPEFEKLGLLKDGIYKKTEYAIESIIDACAIQNADHALGIPSDTDDIIDNLRKAELIKDETAEKIKEIKAFRNVLVHKYGKIDDKRSYEGIKAGVTDITDIIKEMRKKINLG